LAVRLFPLSIERGKVGSQKKAQRIALVDELADPSLLPSCCRDLAGTFQIVEQIFSSSDHEIEDTGAVLPHDGKVEIGDSLSGSGNLEAHNQEPPAPGVSIAFEFSPQAAIGGDDDVKTPSKGTRRFDLLNSAIIRSPPTRLLRMLAL